MRAFYHMIGSQDNPLRVDNHPRAQRSLTALLRHSPIALAEKLGEWIPPKWGRNATPISHNSFGRNIHDRGGDTLGDVGKSNLSRRKQRRMNGDGERFRRVGARIT
jgi:hypothetical protein